MVALGVVGSIRRCIEKWFIPIQSIVYLDFRKLQIQFFAHNTTRESWIEVTMLVCGWCQTISGKSKRQYDYFHCAYQILHNCFRQCIHDDVIKWKHFPRHSHRWFSSQRPVTRSFEVFFNLRLNQRLNKQSRHRWLETPLHSIWRQCNVEHVNNPGLLTSIFLLASRSITCVIHTK